MPLHFDLGADRVSLAFVTITARANPSPPFQDVLAAMQKRYLTAELRPLHQPPQQSAPGPPPFQAPCEAKRISNLSLC